MVSFFKSQIAEGKDMDHKRYSSFRLYTLAQCLYWVCGCAVVSFAVVYLRDKGFSQSQAGLICSAAAGLSFLLTGALSALMDSGRAGPASLGSGLFGLAALSLLVVRLDVRAALLTAILYALAIAAMQTAVFFYNKLYADLSYLGIPLDFGIARGLGSVSFSLASFSFGMLIRDLGSRFLPGIAAALAVLQLGCVLALCRKARGADQTERKSAPKNGSLFRFLREHRRFTSFLIGASLISASNMTFTTFLIHITERAGGSPGTLGVLNAYMALIEIPVMLCYSRIRARVSLRTLVAIGLAFYCVKLWGFTLSVNLPLLFLAATMHTLSFGLFTPAAVDYVKDSVPQADSAKGQGLMVSTPVLCSCVTLAVFGALLDHLGLVPALCLFSSLSLLGLLLCLLSV